MRISPEIFEQWSSNLAPEMYIKKETKWQLSCCCHDNSYATGPVLIKTKVPNNLMGRVKTMWEPCLFPGRPPAPLKKVANRDIWFYKERDWNQGCCHGNNILFLLWCTFLVPSLKITAPIFLEIFLIQYFIVLVERSMTSSLPSFAYYKNVNISKTKKDIPKRKTPLFLFYQTSLEACSCCFISIPFGLGKIEHTS